MNPDSVEGLIQNILSALYPPFEATAPIVLGQLFQVIEGRYQGDALRCLLDFLVPAKHILESVQQAACAQFSDVVFLCEGWPLCLRDQIVIHLAPINSLLLRPGDFFLQVVPFCSQSTRIVVCSLLEEEGLRVKVVEETPIAETCYPCIFTSDWLEEINRGRHGTPLSQCLLATEQGVIRLPWEWVAVPEFVEVPQRAETIMASARPSSPPRPLPLSRPSFSPAAAAAQDSPTNPSIHLSFAKESPSNRPPTTILCSLPTAKRESATERSPHPCAFSVETRICPAKHGIAVSLCLVENSTAASSRLVKVNDTESKPIGWVSPNTWDSRCPGTGTAKGSQSVDSTISIRENTNRSAGTDKSESTLGSVDSKQDTNLLGSNTNHSTDKICKINIEEGEYIDILQAAMLFGGARALAQQAQQQQNQAPMYPQAPTQTRIHPHAQMQSQTVTCTQARPHLLQQTPTYSQTQMQPPTKTHTLPQSGPAMLFKHNLQSEAGPRPALDHSYQQDPHHHLHSHSPASHRECVRTVQFSEAPCTPCMTRRQGGKVSRAQELRCRYRESYQAAIQNPVAIEREKEWGNTLSVLDEDGYDFNSSGDGRQVPPEIERRGYPWYNAQGGCCDPGIQNQTTPPACDVVCNESGERNSVPCWTPGGENLAVCMDSNTLRCDGKTGLTVEPHPWRLGERKTAPCWESRDAHSYNKPPGVVHYQEVETKHETNVGFGGNIDATTSQRVLLSSNAPKRIDMNSFKPCVLPPSASSLSGTNANIVKPHTILPNRLNPTGMNSSICKVLENNSDSAEVHVNIARPRVVLQNRREATEVDRRCSSLSTTVVDTSEKCEVVVVRGQSVRKIDNTVSSTEEVPRLHVVKCKNTTAFGLVSPKINRRKIFNKGNQPVKAVSGNVQQTENREQTHPPPTTENQTTPQPEPILPRPDYLPLGCPDIGTHPLYLGIACLTGGRDRTGRAVVEAYGDHLGWRSFVTNQELSQTLLYFHSIIRRETRELGMTVVVDARKSPPPPYFFKALTMLQEQTPQVVHHMVVLGEKDISHRPDRCPGIQTEIVTSVKALHKMVEANQLTSCLDGTLSYSHHDWLDLHQKLHPFVSDLHEAAALLQKAIRKLEETQKIDTVPNVQQCIVDQRTLMRDVLQDSRLVGLQREGGANLARLRRESDMKYPHCEDFSDAVDSVTSLYNHVEEQAHFLVQRSNVLQEHLEYLLRLREMEGHFTQIKEWFDAEGQRHLLEAAEVEDSKYRVEQTLNSFTAFLIEANDRNHHAMALVSEAERLQADGLSYPETEVFRTLVRTFKSDLGNFLSRAEACCRELQIMVNVCDFCEQATALAMECKEYLDQNQPNTHPLQQDPNTTTHPPHTHFTQDQHHEHDHNTTPHHQFNTQPLQYQQHDHDLNTIPVPEVGPTTPDIPLTGHDPTLLQAYELRFLHFSPEQFQEVKAQACSLRGSRGMRVWNVAWLKCQEARQQLQERMQDVNEAYHQQHQTAWCDHHSAEGDLDGQTVSPSGQIMALQSTPGPGHPQWEGIITGTVEMRKRRPILGNSNTNSISEAFCDAAKPENMLPSYDARTNEGSRVSPDSPHRSPRRTEREIKKREVNNRARRERDAAALSQSHTVGCQWFPWGRGLGTRSVSEASCSTVVASPTAGSGSAPTLPEPLAQTSSPCSHRGQPSCRILQEAQRFQISRHGSFCSEESFVGALEAAGGNGTSCGKTSSLPVGSEESTSNALRLQRVLEELVFTEREYVRSLGYILTHYHPLLDRPDIPQDLRGKRGVIFGNLEKLYDFHSHYFLPELEACQREPALVARCFLRHSESFGLYAHYSKNKPQSDALILHRRHDIFKRKQQELGDMMDLSSYLLRPIQRISKYSLLLLDMLALTSSHKTHDMVHDGTCGPSVCDASVCDSEMMNHEREKAEIQAAADLVRFQMRHGNDLLTMDAIRDCDVNLKEQGQLIRQDEFTVFFRKKKCVRRIFLFEHLILFSKTKRTDVGNDVYVYKQSFKTCDIGMTHNAGVTGLSFEIWFRRRKSEDTYTLRAFSMEVKKAWTTDVERILWEQAAHSRELRMQERVFMGMGKKPFMDIQPSEAAICDRAVNYVVPGRIPVACCSHRGLEYPRPHSIGSGSTASTTLSQSSSSSGRGSLPPIGNQSQGVETNHIGCSSPEAATENEINNHHLYHHHLHHNCEQQKPNGYLLMDNTESSGDHVSVFGNSEHSCLSPIGGDVIDSSSFASHTSKPHPSLSRTPSLRMNESPMVNRKKRTAPKPPVLTTSQDNDIVIGKSTEV